MRHNLFSFFLIICSCISCSKISQLEYALDKAGSNRIELEKVLHHYQYINPDKEKLSAEISNI